MSEVERYRRRARACLTLADTAEGPEARQGYRQAASSWLLLAEKFAPSREADSFVAARAEPRSGGLPPFRSNGSVPLLRLKPARPAAAVRESHQ